ncbi:hypothetical protein [Sulfidibacter corallicola]|uniref:Uncharacterized protein n=1 Tax=Sulfidibacter corallicola TaxID=2818388 RepID=A0A8A4THG9_SULCO|nr:hypothetical protein [Sulfidibacter corallicola]QTD48198.1 hypothetical protein J3U87_21645 [Sulfidibacter corallicola]
MNLVVLTIKGKCGVNHGARFAPLRLLGKALRPCAIGFEKVSAPSVGLCLEKNLQYLTCLSPLAGFGMEFRPVRKLLYRQIFYRRLFSLPAFFPFLSHDFLVFSAERSIQPISVFWNLSMIPPYS